MRNTDHVIAICSPRDRVIVDHVILTKRTHFVVYRYGHSIEQRYSCQMLLHFLNFSRLIKLTPVLFVLLIMVLLTSTYVKAVKGSILFANKTFEALTPRYDSVPEENTMLRKHNDEPKEVRRTLKIRIQMLRRYSRPNNLGIRVFPCSAREDLLSAMTFAGERIASPV